jgi:hypothetical protein
MEFASQRALELSKSSASACPSTWDLSKHYLSSRTISRLPLHGRTSPDLTSHNYVAQSFEDPTHWQRDCSKVLWDDDPVTRRSDILH